MERLRDLIVSLTTGSRSRSTTRACASTGWCPRHTRIGAGSSPSPGGFLAAGAAGLVGAGPFIVILSFLTAVLVGRVLAWLSGAGVATCFTRGRRGGDPDGSWRPSSSSRQSRGITFFGDVSPSLVVASGIVLLLSGMSVVGAAEDALEGYYVTAGARAFEVVVLSLGIAVGISAVLSLGQRLGFPIAVAAQTRLTDDIWVQPACAVVISAKLSP